jgi:hypothetical protein
MGIPAWILFILLFLFAGIWAVLHFIYRAQRKEETFRGKDLGLEDLSSIKSNLSEEEYRKIRQSLVQKMTRDGSSAKKEINLAELEAQFNRDSQKEQSKPRAGGNAGKAG